MPFSRELAPFVLIISNDPDENPIINKIDVPDAAFLTDVSIPLQAIASARDGRGRLAVQQLDSVLGVLTKSECGDDTAHIRVWPQYVNQDARRQKEEEVTAGLVELVALDTDYRFTCTSRPKAQMRKLQNENKDRNPKDLGRLRRPRRPAWRPGAEGLLRRRSLQDRRQAIDLAFD